MAKIKLLKYPKKPKSNASLSRMENFISRCAFIDKENTRRKQLEKRREDLKKKIAAMKTSVNSYR